MKHKPKPVSWSDIVTWKNKHGWTTPMPTRVEVWPSGYPKIGKPVKVKG